MNNFSNKTKHFYINTSFISSWLVYNIIEKSTRENFCNEKVRKKDITDCQ